MELPHKKVTATAKSLLDVHLTLLLSHMTPRRARAGGGREGNPTQGQNSESDARWLEIKDRTPNTTAAMWC
jgi:hypothetical protein